MMQKNKKLRLLALTAAMLAALHSAINCILIVFPKPIVNLMNLMHDSDTKIPALLTAFRFVDALFPLLLTAICLYMGLGKELKPKKTSISLILLVVYYGLSLTRGYTNYIVNNIILRLYDSTIFGTYNVLKSISSFVPPFATIALMLAIAVAAIEFYETHKKD